MGREEGAHRDPIVFLNSGINLIVEKGNCQEKNCVHTQTGVNSGACNIGKNTMNVSECCFFFFFLIR